jgi:hypothetical protein
MVQSRGVLLASLGGKSLISFCSHPSIPPALALSKHLCADIMQVQSSNTWAHAGFAVDCLLGKAFSRLSARFHK